MYTCHYGLRFDFAKLAFWRLPKGDIAQFMHHPNSVKFIIPFATLLGILWGYIYAGIVSIGLHKAPSVSES
jgi:hypothetical protein